jgi:hypothetical protein
MPVMVAVSVEKNDQPCYVKMEVVESLNRRAADEFVHKYVAPGSKVTTDGLNIYSELKSCRLSIRAYYYQ